MTMVHVAPAVDRRPVQELHTDVLVAGGGAAGLAGNCPPVGVVAGGGGGGGAPAEPPARQGCKVVLVERYGFCGGGAVAGLSGTICGLYEASEGNAPPRQLVHGFV